LPRHDKLKLIGHQTLLNGHYIAGNGVDVNLSGPGSSNFPGKMKLKRICVALRWQDIQYEITGSNFGCRRYLKS
jgi:hypothetical protein